MKFKRMIALLLVALLSFALFACNDNNKDDQSINGSSEVKNTIVGKYMLYSMEDNGEKTEYDVIVMAGLSDSYIELKADKTFTMALTGEEPENGTYDDAKGEIVDSDGVAIPMKWEDDKIVITFEENSYATFVREGSEILKKSETFESIEAGSSDTIVGKYMLYGMEAEGVTLDYDTIKNAGMASSYLEFTEDGKFILSFANDDPGEGTYDADSKTLTGTDGASINYTVDGEKVSISYEGSTMVFVKEGSGLLSADGETSDDNSENNNTANGDVYGSYVLVGEGYSEGNYSEPYTPGYVILNEGGTGIYCSNTTEMDLAWTLNGNDFDGTVTAFGEIKMVGTLVNGILEVVYGDGFFMQFEKGEIPSDNGNGESEDDNDGEDTASLEAYGGDWHGMILFSDCTGKFEGNNDVSAEMIARLIIGEDGEITPFLAAAIGADDNDKNLKNIELAHYTEDGYDFLFMRGEFYGSELADDCFIERDGETLIVYVHVIDDDGDELAFYSCLRHLDDEWDIENDFLYFEEEMYDFYYGMTLEEIAVLYGIDESVIPEA